MLVRPARQKLRQLRHVMMLRCRGFQPRKMEGELVVCCFFFLGGMKSYPILRYGDSMGIIYIYIIYPLLGCPGVLEVRILMVNGSIGLVITYLQMEYFGVT